MLPYTGLELCGDSKQGIHTNPTKKTDDWHDQQFS